MKEIKLRPYIVLGLSLRSLLDIHEGMSVLTQSNRNEVTILGNLNRLKALLIELGLNVTYQAFIGELEEHRDNFEELSEDIILTKQLAEDIVERVRSVSNIMKYEATNLQAYIFEDKRLPVNKLLSNTDSLFGDNVFRFLPELSQYDFAQAGKCIAFELPTASAFHMLRGTEGLLRIYYKLLSPNAPTDCQPSWGHIVLELRKIENDPPAKELVDNLDNIRASFRNPTQHPEKMYDLDEAQDLFNLCVDAVNRMAKELFRRKIWDEDNPW